LDEATVFAGPLLAAGLLPADGPDVFVLLDFEEAFIFNMKKDSITKI